jgi:hypothetical protein
MHSLSKHKKGEQTMKTIAIDISKSVFNNETEAIMYVTKDDDMYIFAVPVITFSWSAKDESELDSLSFNIFGDKEKQQRLVNEMKKAIHAFKTHTAN